MPFIRTAYTLLELITVVTLIGIVAAIVVTHVTSESSNAKISSCQAYKGDIEIQAEIWMHNEGKWPVTNLSNIGASSEYFPEGLPTCPVDGSSYTINTSTGRVIGHNH